DHQRRPQARGTRACASAAVQLQRGRKARGGRAGRTTPFRKRVNATPVTNRARIGPSSRSWSGGVDGSSPSEGFTSSAADRSVVFGRERSDRVDLGSGQ